MLGTRAREPNVLTTYVVWVVTVRGLELYNLHNQKLTGVPKSFEPVCNDMAMNTLQSHRSALQSATGC